LNWLTEELHAKRFLLRHAETLGLGWVDRWILRLQLQRLEKYGVTSWNTISMLKTT
jgi:hypothetical protein